MDACDESIELDDEDDTPHWLLEAEALLKLATQGSNPRTPDGSAQHWGEGEADEMQEQLESMRRAMKMQSAFIKTLQAKNEVLQERLALRETDWT